MRQAKPKGYTRRTSNGSKARRQHSGKSGQYNKQPSVEQTKRNIEKQELLAKRFLSSGDRVEAERALQHAEHLRRLLQAMLPSDALDVDDPLVKNSPVRSREVALTAPNDATTIDPASTLPETDEASSIDKAVETKAIDTEMTETSDDNPAEEFLPDFLTTR